VGEAAAALIGQVGARLITADAPGALGGAPAEAAAALAVDVCDEASVTGLFADIAARFGDIDVLVYAATLPAGFAFETMSLADWRKVQEVNLQGAFLCLREAVKMMRRPGRGGRIVVVSTMGARHPVLNGNAAYGAAKAGLDGLVRSVALDYAADGILANLVLAGAVPPGAARIGDVEPSGPSRGPGRLLLGRAEAAAIAPAILYLVSPAGGFVTGQALPVDGGFLIS
ncbi:MAG: SDR family oxidoreductase, partial [Caulobacteraceae bacterium]|nr:SDR family oxidoreductase [Caulobacteraceae bacterium]